MNLNEFQEKAANHKNGRAVVLACPGSGKTRTVTERINRLIEFGVSPSNILCITFTNAAANEMKKRVMEKYGESSKDIYISTFHSLCAHILRKVGQSIGYNDDTIILDEDEQVSTIQQMARIRDMEIDRFAAADIARTCNDYREKLLDSPNQLHKYANIDINPIEFEIIKDYLGKIKNINKIDFTGLLTETIRLLEENEEIRKKLQSKFKYIMVDEAQDANLAQFRIVELLSGDEDNVLIVGDLDQSIYTWRGANPKGVQDFINNAKNGCEVYKLGKNYRCTPEIIKIADNLIRNNKSRIVIDFSTDNKSGPSPFLNKYQTPEEEAENISFEVRRLLDAGLKGKDIAIFYRTNAQSRTLEQKLVKNQIPYVNIGGGSFFDRMEIKDSLAFLKFISNPYDGISFHRIANKPQKEIGDKTIGKIEAFAMSQKTESGHISILEACKRSKEYIGGKVSDKILELHSVFNFDYSNMNIAKILSELLSRSGYRDWISKNYKTSEEIDDRIRNLEEFIVSVGQFCEENPNSTIPSYLNNIALISSADTLGEDQMVRLMTLHACKGTEFPVVYIVGLEHNILPHKLAVQERPIEGLEEERRLCYVGFTRAKKVLKVSWCSSRPIWKQQRVLYAPSKPSQFLLESGLINKNDFEKANKGPLCDGSH